ncbi:hypothetical protein [Salipaludibacillus daqingensis]|uniref:hypothetical protein n=1 Tax=Salipaludibacillus daqingensis TaxID=3041001 RepID=UPI0024735BF0|nr:hypothetical protein [Salipaludibacillus daqingensis]
MKKLVSFVFISMLFILAACSNNEEESAGNYNPSDYDLSAISTSGEEVELFQEGEQALYLYFTGVD